MTAAELTDWTAYEQVYGPLLVQDRVDIGLAQVSLILVRLFSKKSNHTLRDFLPSWWQPLLGRAERTDASVVRTMEALISRAKHADN